MAAYKQWIKPWLQWSRKGILSMLVVICVAAVTTLEASENRRRDPNTVPAHLEAFTSTGAQAPDRNTEILHIVEHDDRLFATTSQWMSATTTGAQVLVKDTATEPWRIFERFAVLRVTALASLTIPAAYNAGQERSLLLAWGRRHSPQHPAEILWLPEGATQFASTFVLPANDRVRAFGLHPEAQTIGIYVGANPSGILRGTWNPVTQTIDWNATPEVTLPSSGELGSKVTGFASCGGALYGTIHTQILRRNDGELAPDMPRWVPFMQGPEVHERNSGWRGLTCIQHQSQPALLVSLEGSGTIYRIDNLPQGNFKDLPKPQKVVELEPRQIIHQALQSVGTPLPETGPGAVGYIIAAYNEFLAIPDLPNTTHIAGVEWSYKGKDTCPSRYRTCLPHPDFDAAACLLLRSIPPGQTEPQYRFRCLGGGDFQAQAPAQLQAPITFQQAFVAVRTLRPSPFEPYQLYLAGYDANYVEADRTAWIARMDWRQLLSEHP